jgi:nicotinic acid phosphoribosyltransferase
VTGNELDAYPRQVRAVVERFFASPEDAYGFVGVTTTEIEALGFEQRKTEDATAPLEARLATFEAELLDALDLFALQHDEIDSYGDEFAKQLYGEVISTLMALRALWRCIPELRIPE